MSADTPPLPPPAPPLGALDPEPEPAQPLEPPEVMHKTRAVDFLGRRTPIVYQNDNGPCPLLAICNVLLLKNVISLNPDAGEVSQQKLLSLVADRLIDSNSSAQGKDEEYARNWEHNISDAIDLLPRLTTGIDVNVMFRKVDDFEFTPERAIFDLLDIPLYHGWIVDPQDNDTASAIGSKSYNALASGLAEFKSEKPAEEDKHVAEEETVDFAAATAAALGVPSPTVSLGKSFDESTLSDSAELQMRRGDREEDEELRRVLSLSKAESTDVVDGSVTFSTSQSHSSSNIEDIPRSESFVLEAPEVVGPSNKEEGSHASSHDSTLQNTNSDANVSEAVSSESEQALTSKETEEDGKMVVLVEHLDIPVQSSESTVACPSHEPSVLDGEASAPAPDLAEASKETCREHSTMQIHDTQASDSAPQVPDTENSCDPTTVISQATPMGATPQASDTAPQVSDTENSCDSANVTSQATPMGTTPEQDEKIVALDTAGLASSSIQANEPIYQGEEHVLGSGNMAFQTEEPVYEGEVVLAEQADKTAESSQCLGSGAADHQWDLIDNFLQSTANQLTVYGLFCLQEGLKERELCVFFRNNHFNTMFKYNGSLYLLATDQGFFSQTDLVWQRLDEVNGDGVFLTSNFTPFTAETPRNDSWNQQQAMTTTADYIAQFDNSTLPNSSGDSDLELAIALQQQEFEQQPQRHQPPPQQQQPQQQQQQQQTQTHQAPNQSSGRPGLVVGPRRSNVPPPAKTESKKEKCIVM
ncbi:ubiquitin carboxyl-terminal hydrolase MINDY-2 isoform X2 [Hordeum vulgare subsp. vulgare]|uniref:ubiquitin carboxyl-terminal hydrolase MINDY-2 isoform X2 n=1 Tax=Hordeum vulgare subsp. vulgare TaxID=112509 RepID=UPI000B46AF86|nr:ubiquitin carboxyl-terminal hydrolase MINDY-2 isoform X2 [Hordeum vulgare subsp. vulgare]